MSLLASARAGNREALGNLTELYRNYLYLVAQVQVDRHIRRRLTPSDLVQETMIKAVKNGSICAAWLRGLLIRPLPAIRKAGQA